MIGTGTSSGENHFKAAGANWIYNESVLGTFVDEVSSSLRRAGEKYVLACTYVHVCVCIFFFLCGGEGVEYAR